MNAITEVNYSSAKKVDYTPVQKTQDTVPTDVKQSVTTLEKPINTGDGNTQRPQSEEKQKAYSEKNKTQEQNISFVKVSENVKTEEVKEINLLEASKAYREEQSKKEQNFSLNGELQVEKFIPPVPVTEIKAPEGGLLKTLPIDDRAKEELTESYGIVQ